MDEVNDISYLQQIQLDLSAVRLTLDAQQTAEKPDYYKKLEEMQVILSSIQEKLSWDSVPTESLATMVQLDESTMKTLEEIRLHSQNSENWLIAVSIGVGLLFGIICTLIFSNFVRH